MRVGLVVCTVRITSELNVHPPHTEFSSQHFSLHKVCFFAKASSCLRGFSVWRAAVT